MALRIALSYRCEDRDARSVYSRIVPAGLLCIHGVLLEAGFSSHVFNFSGHSWKSIRQILASFQPRIVGVSHFTYNHTSSMRLYETARVVAPEALILGGGEQATFLDEQILRRSSSIDAIVRGEAENTMLELAKRVAGGEDWQLAASLSYPTSRGVTRNPDCQVAQDLDSCYPIARFSELTGVRPEEHRGAGKRERLFEKRDSSSVAVDRSVHVFSARLGELLPGPRRCRGGERSFRRDPGAMAAPSVGAPGPGRLGRSLRPSARRPAPPRNCQAGGNVCRQLKSQPGSCAPRGPSAACGAVRQSPGPSRAYVPGKHYIMLSAWDKIDRFGSCI
jgi:hypothetical protein